MLQQAAKLDSGWQQDMEDVQPTAGQAKIQAKIQIAKVGALKVADGVEKVHPAAIGVSKAQHDTSSK